MNDSSIMAPATFAPLPQSRTFFPAHLIMKIRTTIRCFLLFFLPLLARSAFAESINFADPLDGAGASVSHWRQLPAPIVDTPDGGRALRCERGQMWNSTDLPWAGDETWSSYRIEVDLLPGENWAEVDFHVQNDGQSACTIMLYPDSHGALSFEGLGIWGEAGAFKLWPVGQREASWQPQHWVHLRIEATDTIANVFVGDDPQPFATFYDLPFARGGVRLTAYAGFAFFRNLRVTALPAGARQPLLDDPWAAARQGSVLRNWQVSPIYAPGAFPDGIPDTIARDATAWQSAPVDGRGVVNLTGHFHSNNRTATAFARTILHAEKDKVRRLALTYTDNFRLWCNGEPVFTGPPRNWFHPDREKYGNSRLIPDQFEVNVSLRTGDNILLVRTETVEPFGWGFWIRVLDMPTRPAALALATSIRQLDRPSFTRFNPVEALRSE